LQEIIPVYFNQLPGGTALRILNHAADLVLGNFRKYNFVDDNFRYYGTSTPPIYDIKKIQVPVYLVYSTQDWATTEPVSSKFKNFEKLTWYSIEKRNEEISVKS
jgi:lysosomal acid lipase/cholesteryl ester hydrolase